MTAHFDALRSIAHHDPESCWAGRSLDSKALVVIEEVAGRLRGLSDVLQGMATLDMVLHGDSHERLRFLANSADDTALALERLSAMQRDAWREADEEAVAAEREAKRAARARRKAGKGVTSNDALGSTLGAEQTRRAAA
jgi:hypothetical protein